MGTDSAGGDRRVTGRWARLGRAAVAGLLACVGIAAVSAPAAAQGESPEATVSVRITAQRLADGRTEFALQHDPAASSGEPFSWGERLLPARQRFFAADAAVESWLVSSPLTVTPAGSAGVIVRITAQRLADDRIEFAVQQQLSDGTWDERRLPARRFFPANAAVERWLNSSPLTWNPSAEPTPPATVPGPPATAGFSAVDSGGAHSCGLRADGAVTCWGGNENGQAQAPAGQFSAVSAGRTHSCGLRSDGTVTCWGGNENGRSDAPDGQFTAISAGGDLSCGLRDDRTAACWGDGFELLDTNSFDPPLLVHAISAAGREGCGLLVDEDNAICVDDSYETYIFDGPFSAISSGADHHCGLRTNNTVTCWGDNSAGRTAAPAGRFSAVSAGGNHSCGLRADGTVVCWGDNSDGQASPPAGVFTAVSAGGNHSCGLRSDGTVTCWGQIN